MPEEKARTTPILGIVLIILGVLMVSGALSIETVLGVAGIVIGALLLIGEFT